MGVAGDGVIGHTDEPDRLLDAAQGDAVVVGNGAEPESGLARKPGTGIRDEAVAVSDEVIAG